MTATWTRWYCELSYLGDLKDERRVSLQRFNQRCFLVTFWQRHCGYGQRQESFNSEHAAKSAGEAWCGIGQKCPTCGR